jgi:tetratricopeptide (TPR) repeat protein
VEDACQLFLSALNIESGFWPARCNLGRAQLEMGEFAEAEEILLQVRHALPGTAVAAGHLGYCYARQGRSNLAEDMLAELDGLSRSRYVSPLHPARILIGLGNRDAAVACIEAALKNRCARLTQLAIDPLYRPLHDDPRFSDVVRAMGLSLS